jgi:predicted enzyme related to lactoylglutathione lyase
MNAVPSTPCTRDTPSLIARLLDNSITLLVHVGLHPAWAFNLASLLTQLIGSALIIVNRRVWLGAGALGVFTAQALKGKSPPTSRYLAESTQLTWGIVMQINRVLRVFVVAWICLAPVSGFGDIAVGPQYDTTHVYVAPEHFDQLVASLLATFGGTQSKQGVFTVTPTPSETMSQLVLTPAGSVSVFGFKTPIPYPFGAERTGYLVKDLDAALRLAQAAGADVIVTPFPDPIGRDVVIQWPGGINMQLYWHTTPPSYSSLQTIPENRVYLSPGKADEFIGRFSRFSQGKVLADEKRAPGIEIGRPGDTYRQIRIDSPFGKLTVLVTDGHLPYPYGRELTGYEVSDLKNTLDKATAGGAKVLVPAFASRGRRSALVEFPGGYIAEIHAATGP